MNRTIQYLLILIGSVLISCGSEDDPVGFPVGSWKLSAIVFKNGPNTTELTSSRLNRFTLEFLSDGTAMSGNTQSEKTLNWTYETASNGLQLSDGANTEGYTVESIDDGEFQYQVADIASMASASLSQSSMAELAANTFNQSKKSYDPSGALKVYFKFEQQ